MEVLVKEWISSSLRDTLAYVLGWTSRRGRVPFDPVSLSLLLGWQLTNGWNHVRTFWFCWTTSSLRASERNDQPQPYCVPSPISTPP